MKPSYMTEMVRHLIDAAQHPDVAKVETFVEVGAVGHAWPPLGLKLTMTDGTAVFISVNATSAPNEDLSTQPDHFTPEDLNVPRVRRPHLSGAGTARAATPA